MNKKIIVAGAGHGGLVAASKLAKAGFEVTVLEKAKEAELGHDWEDRFTFDILREVADCEIEEQPGNTWRYRGDCAFVSPSHRTNVIINYTDETRQKIMWRKSVISALIDYAKNCGVNFRFECAVSAPIEKGGKILGVLTESGEELLCDLVIDAAGCFSPLRSKLPDSCGIEQSLKRGDAFYAWRAYFDKTDSPEGDLPPFEVYLCHECEQGLSWCCTNEDSVDVLIGRIDPLTDKKIDQQLDIFRKNHPWIGNNILHGNKRCVIPVRRPLSIMVCDGYAAVGDSAFMTLPMNGMGIDLSLRAGALLADTVIESKGDFSKAALWKYNRDYHRLYGGATAKNEGLKNALLQLPPEGVDFLFDNRIIQSSDLAGAGQNTNLANLLGKFVRGMKNPKYFFAILNGLIKGSALSKAFRSAPDCYDEAKINKWKENINSKTLAVTRPERN